MSSVKNLKERENITSTRNPNKGVERNVLRNKTKALGDVQNTLHFRSVNPLNSTGKVSGAQKSVSIFNENALPFKTPKTDRKAREAIEQSVQSVSKIEPDWSDIHNHLLCEASLDSISDFLLEYKLTEEQIDSLVKSVKKIGNPLVMPEIDSCDEIEIPQGEKFDEKNYDCLISDLFNDIVLPKVPPPVNVL